MSHGWEAGKASVLLPLGPKSIHKLLADSPGTLIDFGLNHPPESHAELGGFHVIPRQRVCENVEGHLRGTQSCSKDQFRRLVLDDLRARNVRQAAGAPYGIIGCRNLIYQGRWSIWIDGQQIG